MASPSRTSPSPALLVLYGSETGNAEDLAEELGQCARRLRFDTKVEPMNSVDIQTSLIQASLAIFVISTTGQGDLPRNALLLWKKLLRRKLPPACLAPVRFTTFGLGDSSYPKFNWAARKLHKRLEQLGAVEFYPRGEADEQNDDGVDATFLPWLAGLRRYLLEKYPLPDGVLPIPDDELLPPRYPLSIISDANVDLDIHPETAADVDDDKRPPIPSAWEATVVSNERLTPPSHWQDVRLFKFDLSPVPSNLTTAGSPGERKPTTRDKTPLVLAPGDCLTVYPTNPPAAVDALLSLMSWTSKADVPIRLPSASLPPRLFAPAADSARPTLRQLLTHNIDMAAVPRRSFLRSAAQFAADPDQRLRLLELADPRFVDELWDYTTRPRRTVLELLQDFDSVCVPAERLLDVFSLLRGRDLSVANASHHHPDNKADNKADGGPVVAAGAKTTRAELLVALVEYRTILRKPRVGLCSAYLAPLAPGATIRVSHKPPVTPLFAPTHSPRPLVAIATGTGAAPFRALIQERVARNVPGRMLLFFGARNRDADFYFSHEWDALAADTRANPDTGSGANPAALQVFTAFSRDQRQKVYVQDLIRQRADLVARMVREDAVFCLCGGSAKMADACKAAVMDTIRSQGLAETDEMAKEVFGKLNWWQEVWS